MTYDIHGEHGRRGPLRLYAWDVGGRGAGEGGVTDDRERAIRHVHEALRGLETGASGKVRHVALAWRAE